jgi:hypothetical protein
MTSEAVDLLVNCLTSKESELWNSLGEAWYLPENEWKGNVPPYRPIFTDGWSPSGLVNTLTCLGGERMGLKMNLIIFFVFID